ncbi:hypothetical protein ZOSMA_27G00750 [Zostera marina]|uniref:Transmembrane protein n=1 Tax=Zostera marina TaxID=29655 RepID=A0A0K9PD90_ZOSMR|nr:hypothetical protein ZOSMA_27G00750 [Zostera marina]
MTDWAPVLIAVVLFILLSPGLLYQMPGKDRLVEFANMQASGVAIMVHAIILFGIISVFLIVLNVHMDVGNS